CRVDGLCGRKERSQGHCRRVREKESRLIDVLRIRAVVASGRANSRLSATVVTFYMVSRPAPHPSMARFPGKLRPASLKSIHT
ncbi:hypothetical protein, partial [uncultured Thalassospira sp.]|uniref:hypothetical protein n=1 Tax=uncultured Thalassospira sp. TaxID=404382 RepID=UPI002591CB49